MCCVRSTSVSKHNQMWNENAIPGHFLMLGSDTHWKKDIEVMIIQWYLSRWSPWKVFLSEFRDCIGSLHIYRQIRDFPFDVCHWQIWITELTLIHKNIKSVRNSHAQVYQTIWRKTHNDITDKNNNISSEGLDRNYHIYSSSFYQTRWDIRDNAFYR